MTTGIAGLLRRYINNFYKKSFTTSFIDIWKKNAWSFDEYSYCHKEYYDGHESRAAKQTIVLILALIAAGVSFLSEAFLLCSLLVLIALRAYFKSSQHMLIMEIMQVNLMLARLQNGLKSSNSVIERKNS
jgi:hypothetical protein